MSTAVDLLSLYMLDEHTKKLGQSGVLDISGVTGQLPSSLGLPIAANIELYGAGGLEGGAQDTVWIESDLIKAPPSILTKGECGLTRKRQDYVVMIKSPKGFGRYFCQAVSDTVEEHFPNNLHLSQNGEVLTIIKTYQQSNIYLDTASGRWWNRIYVDCEVYYNNKK